MEMRSSLTEKEDQKTLKAKMRERARPKMGKIDIDYQKLHDAFFKLVLVLQIFTLFNFNVYRIGDANFLLFRIILDGRLNRN